MRKRGFTLVELLVVMGIILTLATILLVTVNHVRRVAAIDGEKLDFQAIEAALENYRHDFGSYPNNIQLTTWNPNVGSNPPTAPPAFLSLATALMGPGPGAPQSIGSAGIFTAGDGADGPGFRIQTMNIPASGSGGSITFNSPQPSPPIYTPGQSVWWFDEISAPNAGLVTHTLYGVVSVSGTTKTTASVTAWSPSIGPSGTGVFRIATGRTWGPYLPPERFQVVYIDPTRVGTTADAPANLHYPVLLDRWGGEIQYFPAYGPPNNRVGNKQTTVYSSSYVPNATTLGLTFTYPVTVGPLFGYAAPSTIDTNQPKTATPYGFYSIFDQRDGAPVIDTVSPAGPEAIPWCFYTYTNTRPINPPQTNTDMSLSVKWMLGDDNFNDVIESGSGETYRNPQPYILISAGPDGPTRPDGGFCDFSQIKPGSGPETYQNAFTASGNIYNFDR